MSEKKSSEGGTAAKKPKEPVELWLRVSWCKGCGLCVDYCKPKVLEMDGVVPVAVNIDKCTRCRMCEAVCPDFAIEVDPMDETGIKESGVKL